MRGFVSEELFYESLEQFSTEYREEVLKKLREHSVEYSNLRKEFGQLHDKIETLSKKLQKPEQNLIEQFIEIYSALIILEGNQIYLQGQVDGMRIMKKLNE
jgi:predicted nuclease with TOPRIM domain